MDIVFRDIDDISLFYTEGALNIAFNMGHKFYVTDTVVEAYGDESHIVNDLIKNDTVTLKIFDGDIFEKIQNIFSKYKSSLSIADCSIIYCAIVTNGVLITSEKALLNAAEEYKIKTYSIELYFQEVKLLKIG